MTEINKNNFRFSDDFFFNSALKKFGITDEGLSRRFKYRIPNIKIPALQKFIGTLEGKDVLGVSGSGLTIFNLIDGHCGSPKRIVGFDLSHKQTAYNYFLKNAFMILDREDFLCFFGYPGRIISKYNQKKIQKLIVSRLPKQLSGYLTKHPFLTIRDKKLIKEISCPFIYEGSRFTEIKNHSAGIKFLTFNLNPLFQQQLRDFFSPTSFDIIYLSNALDWLCWHYNLNAQHLKIVFQNLADVSTRNAVIILEHLTTRKSFLSTWLSTVEKSSFQSYNVNKYRWAMYKFYLRAVI